MISVKMISDNPLKQKMTYPPAPWLLKGYAFLTFHLVSSSRGRLFVPKELELVELLPGKTLGSVYLSTYQSGSILAYNELIVAPAYVRYQGKMGAWISHIYVDNPASVAGGREIWGLPKELADFAWDKHGVIVTQKERELCNFSYQKGLFSFTTWWQQPLKGYSFSGLGEELLYFTSNFTSPLGLTKGKLTIPADSPFADLNLGQPILTLNLPQLHLVAEAPEVVGALGGRLGRA